MRVIFRVVSFLGLAVAIIYLGLFFAVVPVVARFDGLPKIVAVQIYDRMYRPVRKALPYRNIVRDTWRDYESYWCEDRMVCDTRGNEPRAEGLMEEQ